MRRQQIRWLVIAVTASIFGWYGSVGQGADWPMWRYDARRGAATPDALPDTLHLQWVRELGTPAPAWPREQDYQGKLEFDRTYQPIVVGGRIIVPSMSSDRVTAYATETGEELWRYYTDGPVRFAPAAWRDRVFVVSDDGHLHCLHAADGQLLWRVRGGPDRRLVWGNERLISCWPARGAPVVADGVVYFAAGIWPFMGIFLHAVDAETGSIIWTNSGSGAIYNLHQHGGAEAFGGIAPQGYLAVQGDRLVVAGGLTVPAVLDRRTGELLAFEQSTATVGKGAGGFDVAACGDFYFNGGKLFSFTDGKPRLELSSPLPLLTPTQIVSLHKGALISLAPELSAEEYEEEDRRGNKVVKTRYRLRELRTARLPVEPDRLLLQAGSRIFVALPNGTIAALDSADDNGTLAVVWQQDVPGQVDHLLAADGRLFAVTREGSLYCFGGESMPVREHRLTQSIADAPPDDEGTLAADESEPGQWIPRQTGKSRGIALVWGLPEVSLVEQLIAGSELHVIAVDPDRERVAAARRQLDEAQLYGRRAHVIAGPPHRVPFPPYLAELVVLPELPRTAGGGGGGRVTGEDLVARAHRVLRPYGGTVCLHVPRDRDTHVADAVKAAGLADSRLERRGEWLMLSRPGPLPGAGQWTHQYGDSANTVFSGDRRVQAPLGLLWFGGPSNQDALPRHAQGPVPQVVGGRSVIEGVHSISARCVYTGRVLWRREFPNIGFPYMASNHSFTELVYINNQPGANFVGSNYVSVSDGIYVVYQDVCHRLDPETGDTLSQFRLPDGPDSESKTGWGYIGISGDYLVAGAAPQMFDDGRIGEKNWNATSSGRVVVMNRHSGDVLWSRDAQYGFRHNAIVPSNGKLFLIDRLSDEALNLLARRGFSRDDSPQLSAHDLATGEMLWSTTQRVFGTWLGYSEQHDVLIQSGRTGGREHLPDEPAERVIAHQGATGSVLWDEPIRYTGPLIIHGDRIISSGRRDGAFHLLTGEPIQRLHPVTGKELPWTHTRTYGCGTVLASQHLLTFRSGAAGYFDVRHDGGTGNLGGFRSGCTPNLIPADGVLNAPDYTRTCSCSYQNQTSLALIHQRDVETWSYSTLPAPEDGEAVRRLGINLGAPGDRLADDGTLWLEYPSVAGPSPDIPITITEGDVPRWFRAHSSLMRPPAGDAAGADRMWPWVAASGLRGAVSLKLTLESGDNPAAKTYTVRLHFAEPDRVESGQRRFDVSLQGDQVLSALDVCDQAAGPQRPLVHEFREIHVTGDLQIDLRPCDDSLPPILSGIELVREGP
jgi:outer membrane protein assembly factor BamB